MKKLSSNSKFKEMKTYFIYILILLTFVYSGCDKPGPTELVEDTNESDNLEIEIIGKDIDNEFYSNGFDTSGVVENIQDYASIITVSGIKLTRNGRTDNISSAQMFLFDKTKPVQSPNGIIIGYNTITPGIARFNNLTARLANYRVRYRESGALIDTVLGKKYELFNLNRRNLLDPFIFPYNSNISFSFNPFIGPASGFDIITPKEVTGNVRVLDAFDQNKFRAELTWQGENVHNFYIIIGGIKRQNEQVFPFFRIRTKDDGRIIIPNSILRNIPRDRFGKISITMIRKYDKLTQLENTELYVSSQSIHTIIIEIP
ncbi:MAG: hypothetical protein MUF28_00325 [Ignavibacterium sp.]|nr:hypothetical protein [Ignavibacterium sp.]